MLWDELLERWRQRMNPRRAGGLPNVAETVMPPPRRRIWWPTLLYGTAALLFVALVGAIVAAVAQLLAAL